MKMYGSADGSDESVQPERVRCDSNPSIDHVPRLPNTRFWRGIVFASSSIESALKLARCQPSTASSSVLLSLNLDVHLSATSVVMSERSTEIALGSPPTPRISA